MFSRGAVVAVIVFDLSLRETFEDVEMWIGEVRKNVRPDCRIVIAGNKTDLHRDEVSRDDIEKWAQTKEIEVVFVSAKTGENVDLLFGTVVKLLPSAAFKVTTADDVEIKKDKKQRKKDCC
jgi:GTPase SAR1 family protein